MHEQLFKDSGSLELATLIGHATVVGLDRRTFLDCLDSSSAANRIQSDLEEGRRLGVKATPTFFVGVEQPNGTVEFKVRITGAQPYEVIAKAVDYLSELQDPGSKESLHTLVNTLSMKCPQGWLVESSCPFTKKEVVCEEPSAS